VLGAALAGALPAWRDVSFSVNMTGGIRGRDDGERSRTAHAAIQRRHAAVRAVPGARGHNRIRHGHDGLHAGNGMTITAAVTFQFGNSPAAPTAVIGTITSGTASSRTRVEPSRGRSPRPDHGYATTCHSRSRLGNPDRPEGAERAERVAGGTDVQHSERIDRAGLHRAWS